MKQPNKILLLVLSLSFVTLRFTNGFATSVPQPAEIVVVDKGSTRCYYYGTTLVGWSDLNNISRPAGLENKLEDLRNETSLEDESEWTNSALESLLLSTGAIRITKTSLPKLTKASSSPSLILTDGAPPVAEDSVNPLLGNIRFNQNLPYNNLAPQVGLVKSQAGCVAVAMAQIMAYHRAPQTGCTGSVSYTSGSTGFKIEADFNGWIPDWENIKDYYGDMSFTTEQGDAVARLVFNCGASVQMDYTVKGIR